MVRKLVYRPGQTFLHRLYPLTKLAWLLLGSILVFIFTEGVILAIFALLCLLAVTILFPDIWRVRGTRLACLTGFFLFALYILFEKSGTTLFDPGLNFFRVTDSGVDMGLRIAGRFLSIIILSYLFILSTNPSDLAYALMKLGLPYRYGFMLVTALRLAPILEDEGSTIYRAQLVRGIRYDRGGLKRWVLLTTQFITPLLISALRRADKLVFSMEGRGFGQFPERTFRQRSAPTPLDLSFNLSMMALAGIFLLINFGGI